MYVQSCIKLENINYHKSPNQEYKTHLRQLQEFKVPRKQQLPTPYHFPKWETAGNSSTLKALVTTHNTEILLLGI